jgi:hypothetical protein
MPVLHSRVKDLGFAVLRSIPRNCTNPFVPDVTHEPYVTVLFRMAQVRMCRWHIVARSTTESVSSARSGSTSRSSVRLCELVVRSENTTARARNETTGRGVAIFFGKEIVRFSWRAHVSRAQSVPSTSRGTGLSNRTRMVASIRSDSVCCSRVRSTGKDLFCTRSRHAHLAPLQGTVPTNSGGSSSCWSRVTRAWSHTSDSVSEP